MSILIKSERIPNNCMDCKMASIEKWYECPFYAIMKEDYSDKRFENCPLVEVPEPHGRLIDADKLYKEVEGHEDDNIMINEYQAALNDAYVSVEYDIEDAPTVIEAEGEE